MWYSHARHRLLVKKKQNLQLLLRILGRQNRNTALRCMTKLQKQGWLIQLYWATKKREDFEFSETVHKAGHGNRVDEFSG